MLLFLSCSSLSWHLIWSAANIKLLPTNARKKRVTEHACRYGAGETCLFFTSFGNDMAGRRGWTAPAAGGGDLVVIPATAGRRAFLFITWRWVSDMLHRRCCTFLAGRTWSHHDAGRRREGSDIPHDMRRRETRWRRLSEVDFLISPSLLRASRVVVAWLVHRSIWR